MQLFRLVAASTRDAAARDSARRAQLAARLARVRDSLEPVESMRLRHRPRRIRITGPVMLVFHPGPVPDVRGAADSPSPEVAALVGEVERAESALERRGDGIGVRVLATYGPSLPLMLDGERFIRNPRVSPDAAGYLFIAPGLGPELHLGWPEEGVLREARRRFGVRARALRLPRVEPL